jgi:hypothetical protein
MTGAIAATMHQSEFRTWTISCMGLVTLIHAPGHTMQFYTGSTQTYRMSVYSPVQCCRFRLAWSQGPACCIKL